MSSNLLSIMIEYKIKITASIGKSPYSPDLALYDFFQFPNQKQRYVEGTYYCVFILTSKVYVDKLTTICD